MRIITRPDFDGIVCAVLLRNALDTSAPVLWVEPYEINDRKEEIREGDIIANLPLVETCSLWFDHHSSNRAEKEHPGAFRIAPSAAGIIFNYYGGKFTRDFTELVRETDKIDSASFSPEEVLHMEDYPYSMLASTISGRNREDETYWNRIVDLLAKESIESILEDPEVEERCRRAVEENKIYAGHLKNHTTCDHNIAVTDFRSLETEPKGNRFLIYSLFPEVHTDVKIRHARENREKIIVSLGRNIFNSTGRVNLGDLVARFGGGGHPGAGSCSFHVDEAERCIEEILRVLQINKEKN